MEKYTNKYAVPIAIDFLQQFCSEKNFKDRILSLAKDIPVDTEALFSEKAELFDLIDEMETASKSALADLTSDIRYYFDHPDEEKKCESLYSFVLLQDMPDTYNVKNLTELFEHLEQMPEEYYQKTFGGILYSYNNTMIKDDMEIPNFDSLISVFSLILDMKLPIEIKWKLQDIYLNRSTHREKLLHVLQRTIDFIKIYESQIDDQIEKFYSYWDSERGDRDYYQFLINEFPILSGFPPCPLGYQLYPSLFFHMFSFAMPTDNNSGEPNAPANITLGMIYGNALSLQTVLNAKFSGTNRKKCMDAIKLLSDKSRFAIMKYISDKEENEAYGSEIAKYLGLTTATVSHHMNTLYEAGLVTIQKRKTKLFYSVDKEMLRKYIEHCEQQLL